MHTWEGWLYVALVIDCYSRKIVGWAMADNYKTPLIQTAIRMAARNVSLPEGAIFHSDYAEVDVKPRKSWFGLSVRGSRSIPRLNGSAARGARLRDPHVLEGDVTWLVKTP